MLKSMLGNQLYDSINKIDNIFFWQRTQMLSHSTMYYEVPKRLTFSKYK